MAAGTVRILIVAEKPLTVDGVDAHPGQTIDGVSAVEARKLIKAGKAEEA